MRKKGTKIIVLKMCKKSTEIIVGKMRKKGTNGKKAVQVLKFIKGFIFSSYDISFCIFVIPLSHFTRNFSKETLYFYMCGYIHFNIYI